MNEVDLQKEQLGRYLEWVEREGGTELPTRLSTITQPEQLVRLSFLKKRCRGKIMELGTCYGFVLAFCNGHIGVDRNERSIELARILNPEKTFLVADVRHVPYDDKSVDTVLLPDVLEHLPFEVVPLAINEAIRLARQKVLITIPEANSRHSTCFKHQWLCTEKALKVLTRDLRHPFMVNRLAGFILMEINVRRT